MYEGFFGLQKRPFASVPAVDQYFPAASIENARQTLLRCIQRAAGVAMVVGAAGTGKTLLCQLLAEQFKTEFEVALLCSGRLSTRRALLQAIQHELGQPYRGMDEGELRLALIDHLTLCGQCPNGLVLLVDEAHTLPLKLFEEIRMITNLVCGGQPRVRVVVAGGPALEERFASPKLEAFSQRLAARCYLEPLNRTETQQYIRSQIEKAAGRAGSLITEDACTAVFQATGGVPRLINQVCDHALLLAYVNGRQRVEAACVEEAWADLQQLPTPASAAATRPQSPGVVEFGTLDDAPEAPATWPAETSGEEPFEDVLPAEDAEADFVPPEAEEVAEEGTATQPIERLEEIEQALAEMDEGNIGAGPETLEGKDVFGQSNDPFAERFQEEELIVDPYAAKTLPVQAAASRAAHPAPSSGGLPRRWDFPLSDWDAASRYAATPRDRNLEVNRAASLQQAAQAPEIGRAEGTEEEAPETLPLHPAIAPAPPAAGDAEMIVVEDGYDDSRPASDRPIIPVRRQEYRQLFARLRRG